MPSMSYRCLRRGDGREGPVVGQATPPVEAPGAVPVSASGDVTGDSHTRQVFRYTAQRDRVLPLLPEQGRKYYKTV